MDKLVQINHEKMHKHYVDMYGYQPVEDIYGWHNGWDPATGTLNPDGTTNPIPGMIPLGMGPNGPADPSILNPSGFGHPQTTGDMTVNPEGIQKELSKQQHVYHEHDHASAHGTTLGA